MLGYSLTKRTTAWCHVVLGVALGIAPVGAYIAVTGQLFAVWPILMTGLVITWVSGFDVIYALQDIEFDRQHGLHSIPARWGVRGALIISILLHLISVYAIIMLGLSYNAGTFYWIGTTLFIALLLFQHLYVTAKHFDRIGPSFGLLNGLTSVCFAVCAIIDLYLHYHYC